MVPSLISRERSMNDICTSVDDQNVVVSRLLARPSDVLLAFDFDGVLSSIVDEPARARLHPRARPLLFSIMEHVDSIAIISGRPVEFLCSAFELPNDSQITVFGHYGLERLGDNINNVGQHMKNTIRELEDYVFAEIESMGYSPDFIEKKIIERKTTRGTMISIAVHSRNIDNSDLFIENILKLLLDLKDRYQFSIQPGRKVIEVRPNGVNKGDTLRSYVNERNVKTVVYFGDDLGDLPAFRVIDELCDEGLIGLKVCSW